MALTDPNISTQDVEEALSSLSLTSNGQTSSSIATLAAASKESVPVRQRLASPETLQLLITALECHLSTSLETVDLALRCIANACADNPAGRDGITSLGFSWAVQCFAIEDDQLSLLTTKVLFNICSDHEDAQRKCFREKVHVSLIAFLVGDYARKSPAEATFAIDVLFWIGGVKANAEANADDDVLPDQTLVDLVNLPAIYSQNVDLESFASLSETVLAFIRDPKVQERLIANRQLDRVFGILQEQQRKAGQLDEANEEGAEDRKMLLALSTSYVWCLSDMAALPAFSTIYILEDEEVKNMLLTNIGMGSDDEREQLRDPDGMLITAFFQVLGNLLWTLPAEQYAHLVEREGLHRPVLERILATGERKEDAGVLHSAAGLLIQLSRPSTLVREIIGDNDFAQPALKRLLRHETSNVKQEGVKLLRALGKECPANQERFAELAKEAMLVSADSKDTPMLESSSG